MSSVGPPACGVKLSDFIGHVMAEGCQASLDAKQAALQGHIDQVTTHAMGRKLRELKTSGLDSQLSPWQCSACGSRTSGWFSYSGSYRRTLVFADGDQQVRIPRIRCRCGGNVKPDFGAALPKRKRHWYDLDLTATELHVEGCSYRAVARFFARRDCHIGIGTLARRLRLFRSVDINASVLGQYARALSLDAAFWRVAGAARAHYYVHEVLGRDQPLMRGGKQVAWHRMGKVLACHVAEEETQQAWEETLERVTKACLVDDQEAVWVVSDGNRGLLAAVDMHLPWSVRQRCVWHIAHRARARVTTVDKDHFERDALWVFNGSDHDEAFGRLGSFVGRWHHREPDAVNSVVRKFDGGVQYLGHGELPLRPRTSGISERYNQEPKRRFRAMRGFGNEDNMRAMTRLIALRHNCKIDGIDWLAYAAGSVWDQHIAATAQPQQQEGPEPPHYTKEGT